MEKRYLKVNNEEIAYIETSKKDKTLVLIHGNMSSSIHFLPLINRLEDEYHIIAMDMRGFGDSTYNSNIESLEDLSDDIIELLRLLGVDKYSLLGWSTGGAIAMKIAAKKQDAVQKLVLLESCSYRGYPILKKDETGQPILNAFYENKEEMALDPVQVKPMLDVFESKNKPIIYAVWDQAIYTVNKPSAEDNDLYLDETLKQRNLLDIDWCLTTFNMSDFTNGVTDGDGTIKDVICPVLSFWGDKDLVVLEYMVDETVKALSDVKKVTLSNSGHSPLVDCPDLLAKEIKEFIK